MAYIQGYSTYCGLDMMNQFELKDMKDVYKSLKLRGWQPLPGANTRAMINIVGDDVVLKSYYTNVLVINLKNYSVCKLWDGFSVTTLKHVNLLLDMFGFKRLNKKEFMNLEINKIYKGFKL